MQIALVQMHMHDDPKQGAQQVHQMMQQSELDQGALVVLPEIALGYWIDDGDDYSRGTDEALQQLQTLAQHHQVFCAASLRIDDANRWMIVGPDGRVRMHYDKIHLFGPLGEEKHYRRGNEVVARSIEIANHQWNIGAAVCYDIRFGGLFRALRQRECELCVIPARWPVQRVHHWRALLHSRAIEFQYFVAGVNAVGPDPRKPGIEYGGGSRLVDPEGHVLIDCDDRPGVFCAQIDASAVARARERLPVWQDRVLD